tara:strand:+ start:152 stop:937 length:786 start_codon:yes stop_codon:yes gene_type:complete
MPSLITKVFASYYNRLIQFGHAGNTGTPTATTNIQSGDGINTAVSLSDDVLQVQPQNDDTTGTMLVKNQSGSSILTVNTTDSVVNVGASQVNSLTLFKNMGLYDFSPLAGRHYPLIASPVMTTSSAQAFAADGDFGLSVDPLTTLDVSAYSVRFATMTWWYLQKDITLDSVRFLAMADGSATLNFHIFSYIIDIDTNHGDLSGGTVHANATVSATSSTIKTGTFTLDAGDIDANRVVIGFAENATDTSDLSVSFDIMYHIR